MSSRIDMILISKELKSKILKTNIRPVISGDHNAVTITIMIEGTNKGPGVWKLNTNLLKKRGLL